MSPLKAASLLRDGAGGVALHLGHPPFLGGVVCRQDVGILTGVEPIPLQVYYMGELVKKSIAFEKSWIVALLIFRIVGDIVSITKQFNATRGRCLFGRITTKAGRNITPSGKISNS